MVWDYLATEILKTIGGKIIDKLFNQLNVKVIQIPICENDDDYDYCFINKHADCYTFNSLGQELKFKLINNSDKKITDIYIIDIKTRQVYSIACEEKKCISLEPHSSIKIKVENIDEYSRSVLYISDDQGYSFHYLALNEILV